MHIRAADVPVRQVDAATLIRTYTTAKQSDQISFVIGDIRGEHNIDVPSVNQSSDRIYFVLQGNGEVLLGEQFVPVVAGDTVLIPMGIPHGIRGVLAVAIVNGPAFCPEQEAPLDRTVVLEPVLRAPRIRYAVDVERLSFGSTMDILDYTGQGDSEFVSLVGGIVHGDYHFSSQYVINEHSDIIYFIVDGGGSFRVGDEVYTAWAGDAVLIAAQTPHGLQGDMTLLAACGPAYNPETERYAS